MAERDGRQAARRQQAAADDEGSAPVAGRVSTIAPPSDDERNGESRCRVHEHYEADQDRGFPDLRKQSGR